MPSMRSEDAQRLWRYAVATDFHALDTSIKTDKRILKYGSVERFLPFHHPIDNSWFTYNVDCSGRLLAIPDKNNIDIYDLDTGFRIVLSGHISEVKVVRFSPTDPKVLVSCSNDLDRAGKDKSNPNEIIIWDVDAERSAQQSRIFVPSDQAAKAGVDAVIAHLGETLQLSTDDTIEIHDALRSVIEKCDVRGRVSASSRLYSNISASFQSPIFSNSGEYLIHLPDPRPKDHGGPARDICLYHLPTKTTTTLSGHNDSIMWIGFSPDDKLIASAGWDGSFRVHDVNGKEVWKWVTDRQNWAAVFSPDSKYLAGTDGSGTVRVWSLESGDETDKYDNGPRWSRTLDWSPNGRHIIVGSEDHGRLRLFAFSDGKIKMVQERKLSTEKSNLEVLDPIMERMLGGFLAVNAAKFLPSPSDTEQRESTRLVHSVTMDEGIEVFDFDKGKGWRFVPQYSEDGSVAMAKPGARQNALVGHIWRKETGEIGVIAPDGVRFWRLD
jgi:WD40 repeat protein